MTEPMLLVQQRWLCNVRTKRFWKQSVRPKIKRVTHKKLLYCGKMITLQSVKNASGRCLAAKIKDKTKSLINGEACRQVAHISVKV